MSHKGSQIEKMKTSWIRNETRRKNKSRNYDKMKAYRNKEMK